MEAFLEWFTPASAWFLAGIILFLLELAIPGLVLLFFGIGAWITALFSLKDSFAAQTAFQFILFTGSSILSLVLLRQRLTEMFYGKEVVEIKGRDADFVGKYVTVSKEIKPNIEGRVDLNGSLWKAISKENLKKGETVLVIEKNNLTLTVQSIQED